MTIYAYDIECFKNFFSATFVEVEDVSKKFVFYVGLEHDDTQELKEFLKQEDITLVGYNSESYDNPMLRFLCLYKGNALTSSLYELSSKLVDDNFRNDKSIIELRYPRNRQGWKSVDLMRILAFDKLGISLKQTAINLKWYRIQDLPIHYKSLVKKEQVELVLDYNLNDVLITIELYKAITPIRKLRESLSQIYHADLNSASDSKMANLILENVYSSELKIDINTVRDLRTQREKVFLGDCIAKFVDFKTAELRDLYDRVSSMYVYKYNGFRYSEQVFFANCVFSLGIGGLHTEDSPGIFVSDENCDIQDMDVASYYPNLIINNKFYPEHLGGNFISVLKKMTQDRIAAKKSGDKVKADGLKISINSLFGKLGSETFWLFDPKQMLSTTVSGQLGLLMLVEDLYLNGIEILSCNTDGIVCRIPKQLKEKYLEIAKNWEKATNLELEFTPYKKYVRRDVNSYITEKADGSTKEKGAFLKEVDLKKSYHMPIVAKALYAYFIKNVPVRETLENCKDIMEFCISQKTGVNFAVELHTMAGIETLQKTNRFFISKKGGSLIKRDFTSKKMTGLYVGKLVTILNNYDKNISFENYNVDLSFYEKEVMKIVDEIEPRQETLFDLSSLGRSFVTKTAVQVTKTEDMVEKIDTVVSINKLGKNQRISRLESLANLYKPVNGISPKYVLVMDFDRKSMMADVYCFARCSRQNIAIDKDAYKKLNLEKGQLIYCKKFSRTSNGYCIADYRVSDRIEEESEFMV